MPVIPNFLPKQLTKLKLRHQVLMVLITLLSLALLSMYLVSGDRTTDVARNLAQRWAEGLAETAARASADPLLLQDYGTLEATLRDIAALPGVLRVDVIKAGDQPLMSLEMIKVGDDNTSANRRNHMKVTYNSGNMPLKFNLGNGIGTQLSNYQGQEVLQAWVNVSDISDVGKIGITFSQATERSALQKVRNEMLIALAIIGLLTILFIHLLMYRALRPLQRVADFSRELIDRLGQSLEHFYGSMEVSELTNTLNELSIRLKSQMDDLHLSETRTREMHTSLVERTARINTVLELSPDGFVLLDHNQNLIFCNPAMKALLGWNNSTVTIPANLEELNRLFARYSDNEYPPISVSGRGAVEEPVTFSLAYPKKRVIRRQLRRNMQGKGESILHFHDITHETAVDEMKSQFIASAAHEFRTPISSIMGFTELLINRDYDEPTRLDLLKTINNKSRLLNRLVTELLDLAGIESRTDNVFDLKLQPLEPLIDNTVNTLVIPDDNRQVQVTHATDLPLVKVDSEKLQQAVSNLLVNAYKYSAGVGTIELSTRLLEDDEQIYVSIEISDAGIGMTEEQVAHAFQRFYRADQSGSTPGTGLGLSLVKEIVDAHDGQLKLESTLGIGTKAVIWLPVK